MRVGEITFGFTTRWCPVLVNKIRQVSFFKIKRNPIFSKIIKRWINHRFNGWHA
jgi:hypothetical protein